MQWKVSLKELNVVLPFCSIFCCLQILQWMNMCCCTVPRKSASQFVLLLSSEQHRSSPKYWSAWWLLLVRKGEFSFDMKGETNTHQYKTSEQTVAISCSGICWMENKKLQFVKQPFKLVPSCLVVEGRNDAQKVKRKQPHTEWSNKISELEHNPPTIHRSYILNHK